MTKLYFDPDHACDAVRDERDELRAQVERLKIREETAKAAIAGSEKEIERLRTGWNECQRYMTLSLGREDALRAEVERLKAAVVEIGAAHVAAQAEVERLTKLLSEADEAGSRFMNDAYAFHDERDTARAEVELLKGVRADLNLVIDNLNAEVEALRAAAMKLDEFWITSTYDPETKNVTVRESAFADLRDLLGLKPKTYA